MKINSLNATFQPKKIGTAHGLQITYLKENSTRNIFVYHEDGKVRGAPLPSLILCLPLVEIVCHYRSVCIKGYKILFNDSVFLVFKVFKDEQLVKKRWQTSLKLELVNEFPDVFMS